MKIIDKEIEKLSDKKVISKCEITPGQFISPVFTRPKDGSHCMILSLKQLNNDITYHHFKMDTLLVALGLITPNCFMALIDLKDAYYSIPIEQDDRKFLRFKWRGQLWQFDCMPNGLALASRKFTKLLKPIFATLRKDDHLSTSFLDDSLLMSDCGGMQAKRAKNSPAFPLFWVHCTPREVGVGTNTSYSVSGGDYRLLQHDGYFDQRAKS